MAMITSNTIIPIMTITIVTIAIVIMVDAEASLMNLEATVTALSAHRHPTSTKVECTLGIMLPCLFFNLIILTGSQSQAKSSTNTILSF